MAGGSGLVDDSHHNKTRDDTGDLGGLTLQIVEVSWDGNHNIFYGGSEIGFSDFLHLDENHGGNLFSRFKDFFSYSGQAAMITPRQVTSGLGAQRVKALQRINIIMLQPQRVVRSSPWVPTELGYTFVDTQATPRKVSSLKSKTVVVVAANKHTVVVCDSGEIFTWGCNREGQLGYGASNSGSNYTPRLVEYLKGKVFIRTSTTKYHTMVLGTDGEVFTYGHRLVTPRSVVVARIIKKNGSTPLKFHRSERLHVVGIAAAMIHSVALTYDGKMFCWVSSDPDLRCQHVYHHPHVYLIH